MPRYSVVFAGTSEFAVPSLETLLTDKDFDVQLVITQPDRPVGRKQLLTPPPVKGIAEKHQIRIAQPENINRDFSIPDQRPDFLIVVSYGQILKKPLLAFPTNAPINVHASLLPSWRGASPIQHALLAGDAETGVTIQKMALELDAGPILAQERLTISARDTYLSVLEKLSIMGASLLVRTLKEPLHPVEQDPKAVTLCRKLTREDGKVDASTMTAEEIDRKVRALSPWPGVSIELQGQQLKILETSLESHPNGHPLPCKNGSVLHLVSVQPVGKKPMNGAAWARGLRASSSSPAAP